MPEDMSEKDVQKYVGKGCQKICQTRMSEDAPERMSIEMSEYMSDKNVKRYVRGSINRNVRNMLDKTGKIYVKRNILQECQKICQTRMLERMPEIMLAKDVRRYVIRYVRKECQKECQNRLLEEMSEDMSEKDVRRYVRKGCQKIRPKKCHKECLY